MCTIGRCLKLTIGRYLQNKQQQYYVHQKAIRNSNHKVKKRARPVAGTLCLRSRYRQTLHERHRERSPQCFTGHHRTYRQQFESAVERAVQSG